MFTSTAVANLRLLKKNVLFHTCETFSELPSYTRYHAGYYLPPTEILCHSDHLSQDHVQILKKISKDLACFLIVVNPTFDMKVCLECHKNTFFQHKESRFTKSPSNLLHIYLFYLIKFTFSKLKDEILMTAGLS